MWTDTIHVTVTFQENCYDSCNYYNLVCWMVVKQCTVCNIKIDVAIFKEDRNICKNCYNTNRKNI